MTEPSLTSRTRSLRTPAAVLLCVVSGCASAGPWRAAGGATSLAGAAAGLSLGTYAIVEGATCCNGGDPAGIAVGIPAALAGAGLGLLGYFLLASENPDGAPVVEARPRLAGAVIAVFDLEDASRALEPGVAEQLTGYLATRLVESTGARVVPPEQLRARLQAAKQEGYGACFDEACRVELGNAVAAGKSLSVRLLRFGAECRLTLDVLDLRTEASEGASSARSGCTADALAGAIDLLMAELQSR